jgi:tetratricopeptide (TPR) repeat protein
VKPKPMGSKPLPVGPAAGEAAPPPAVDASRSPAKPIKLPRAGDAQLLEAWERWKKASKDLDGKGQEAALLQLAQLREEMGIADMESISVGFIREADQRAKGGDAAGAVGLASAAVQLSPHLPAAHFALAEARFQTDLAGVPEWGGALWNGVRELWSDPRYARAALGDLGAGTLFALTATALAAVLMLFARKARYLHHDFHHLFPRAAAGWQSAAMAALLLSLPVVFHAGLTPLLLVLFAASCLYLSTAERAVGAALVACLGLVPVLGGMLTTATAFSGTPADDAHALERGGLDAAPAADRVTRRASDGKASYAELYALGRYQLRRGQLDAALDRFKLAAAKRPSDARLLTNVGNAMLARGDSDGAADSYKSASQADAALAAPLYNVSKLYARRAKVLRSELVGEELDRSHTARDRANALDPSLSKRVDPPEDDLAMNRYLISPELAASELGALAAADEQGGKVVEQLSTTLVGRPGLLSWIYPALAAALLFVLGFASRSGAVSRACQKCGRPVCKKCDPELPAQSELCAQCINVFVKKNAVAAPLRVRKQLEVDRHQTRVGRLSYLFGLICSGAGHVFYGLPVRGVAYTFLFLFVGFSVFYRQGVLRPPYASAPLLLRLLPLGLTFLAVYLLSLRGLYKRQEEG